VPASRPCGLDAIGQYHIGCGVTAPRVISQAYPEYSKEAREKKLDAIVLVGIIVDAHGRPTNVHIVRSASDTADEANHDAALSLDQKALACVQKYRFAPATYQGKPVPVDLNIEVNFQIVK
jgi:TonB family protein